MAAMNTEEKIGEGLVKIGAMAKEQVEDILQRQRDGNDGLFGIMALELGYVGEEVLLDYLEEKGL